MAVIDKAGVEETVENEQDSGEAQDGIEIKADSEIGEAISHEAGKPDSDAGGKDQEDGEQAGEDEGEAGETKEGGDEVEGKDLISDLQAKIGELEKKLSAPPVPKEEPAKPPEISEEQWAKYEEERGIPRNAQTWITQTMVKVVQDMQRAIDQRFAKLDRQDAISTLAKDPEFADAVKYSKEVNQYLEKVDPRHHSNPEVLKDAVIYARGLNYKSGLQKVRDSKEVNKRISGAARPAGSGSSKGGKSAPALTEIQKSAAAAANMSEAEYSKLLGKGRVIAR